MDDGCDSQPTLTVSLHCVSISGFIFHYLKVLSCVHLTVILFLKKFGGRNFEINRTLYSAFCQSPLIMLQSYMLPTQMNLLNNQQISYIYYRFCNHSLLFMCTLVIY